MRPYRAIPIDKPINSGEFVYGWYAKFGDHPVILDGSGWKAYPDDINTLNSYEVHPSTVGQQIGSKDKHGKESYAGDRVDIPRFDNSFVIKWDGFNAKYYMQSEQNNHIIDMRFLPEEGEIIGNIHSEQKDAN